MKSLRLAAFQIALVFLAAAAWKLLFLLWDVVPFNADEAIVALMARHITEGARPVFFYGQAYMGSLDAFLVAGGFALFGEQVWVIRLVQSVLYLGIIAVTIWIGYEAFRSLRPGILAAALLAVPTVNVMLYTTASLGGYGEALLLGSLQVLVSLRLVNGYVRSSSKHFPWILVFLWGVLVGCGLWANGLTLVFSAPSGLYLLWAAWRFRPRWLVCLLLVSGGGILLGSLPWWIFALENGMDRLVMELFGSAVAVEQEPFLVRTANHLVNFLLLGTTAMFGFRPPWEVRWLGLPLMPVALVFWLAVLVYFFRCLVCPAQHRSQMALLAGIFGVLLFGFLATPFGVDPSGRYFLPLVVPLALTAGKMLSELTVRAWQRWGIILLVITFQAWGTIECALRYPPGLTTQIYAPTIIDHRGLPELEAFLRQEGETRGYTSYWVAYPLAFQSGEDLVFIPRLPYHDDMRYTPRDDRYTPYTEMVAQSARVAYITANSQWLDRYLREQFGRLGVNWREQQIGDYLVFYRLSRLVRPQDIGLGEFQE